MIKADLGRACLLDLFRGPDVPLGRPDYQQIRPFTSCFVPVICLLWVSAVHQVLKEELHFVNNNFFFSHCELQYNRNALKWKCPHSLCRVNVRWQMIFRYVREVNGRKEKKGLRNVCFAMKSMISQSHVNRWKRLLNVRWLHVRIAWSLCARFAVCTV